MIHLIGIGKDLMENNTLIETQTLRLLKFHRASERDYSTLIRYFMEYPSRSCDFSIAGLLMWVDYFDYEIAEAFNSLFIKGRIPDTDTFIFYRPVGPLNPEEYLRIIRNYSDRMNIEASILLPEELSVDAEPENSLENPLIDDWKEYLYDIDKFTNFAGRKMEKKRNHLNFFNNHYPEANTEIITEANAAELIEFTTRFDADHFDDDLCRYECEKTNELVSHYDDFNMLGLIIRYESHIIGYTIGEIIGDTLFAHIEKGNIEFRGIYQALASRLCNKALEVSPGLRYVNREEDMGEESLRQSKLSYHPSLYIHKRLVPID